MLFLHFAALFSLGAGKALSCVCSRAGHSPGICICAGRFGPRGHQQFMNNCGCASQSSTTSCPSRPGAAAPSRAHGTRCSCPPPAQGTPCHTAWALGEAASSSGDFVQQCVSGNLSQTGVCWSKGNSGAEARLCAAGMPRGAQEHCPTSSIHVSTSERTPPCRASLLLWAPAGAAMAQLICQYQGFPHDAPSSALLSLPCVPAPWPCSDERVLTSQGAEVRKHGSAFPPGCTDTDEHWLSPVTKAVALCLEMEPPGQRVLTARWGSLQLSRVTFPSAAGGGMHMAP